MFGRLTRKYAVDELYSNQKSIRCNILTSKCTYVYTCTCASVTYVVFQWSLTLVNPLFHSLPSFIVNCYMDVDTLLICYMSTSYIFCLYLQRILSELPPRFIAT